MKKTLLALALSAGIVFPTSAAEIKEIKLHHFLPPMDTMHTDIFQPWANEVSQDSLGLLATKVYPALSLGGIPPQLVTQVEDGFVDVSMVVPAYSGGRFKTTQKYDYPWVAGESAVVTSEQIQNDYETDVAFQEEFKAMHPLFFWTHDKVFLFTNKRIESIEDFKGMKIRAPGKVQSETIAKLGATPVGLPTPKVPSALATGVIDGVVMGAQAAKAFKLDELTKYATSIESNGKVLFSTPFALIMNKDTYNSLDPDMKNAVDANSGMKWSKRAGKAMDDAAEAAIKTFPKGMVYTLNAETIKEIEERLK